LDQIVADHLLNIKVKFRLPYLYCVFKVYFTYLYLYIYVTVMLIINWTKLL